MNLESLMVNAPDLCHTDMGRIRSTVKGLACPMHGKGRKRVTADYDRNENITELEVSGCCCQEFAQIVADKLKPFGLPVVLKDEYAL